MFKIKLLDFGRFFLKKRGSKLEFKLILDNFIIFSGIFFSRVTGFIRDIIFAHLFGIGAISDALIAAQKLPSSFRRIFADGGLLISFVPVFVKENQKDNKESLKFAGRILSLIFVIVAIFVIACIIFMPIVIKITNPGFIKKKEIFSNAVKFARISIIFLLIATISSLMCGMLNAVRKFSYNAYNAVIYNVVVILAYIFCLFFKQSSLENKALFASFSVIIAGFASALYILIGLRRNKLKLRPGKPHFNKQEKEVLSGIFYSIFSFIKVLFDSIFASFFFGGVSFLYYADRIINFPASLIGYTLSASILPVLSKSFSDKNKHDFTKILFLAFKFIAILTIPVIFVLYFFSYDIIHFVYGNSKIQINDLQVLSKMLKIAAFSIIFQISSKVLTSAFFASSNQRLSFIINISSLAINAILIFLMAKKYDIYSIFISSTIINILNFLVMFIFLYKKKVITKLFDKSLLKYILFAFFVGLIAFFIIDQIFPAEIVNKIISLKKILSFVFIYGLIITLSFLLKFFSKKNKINFKSI